ncbi:MAG TPA: GNAT family N-acetyltransferase [Thermomonas sp.]|nr:GNAT family N-acetyltransferase [Thermomonas sp.]
MMKTRLAMVRIANAHDADALAVLLREPFVAVGGRHEEALRGPVHDGQCRDDIPMQEILSNRIDTLVAEAEEGLQGFLQLRWGERAPASGWMRGSVELRRHYVRSRHRGAGVAGRLLERAVDIARARAAVCIWLKVRKESPQAVRFYQKHGFRLAGTAMFADGARMRETWVMHRVVGDRPGARQVAGP